MIDHFQLFAISQFNHIHVSCSIILNFIFLQSLSFLIIFGCRTSHSLYCHYLIIWIRSLKYGFVLFTRGPFSNPEVNTLVVDQQVCITSREIMSLITKKFYFKRTLVPAVSFQCICTVIYILIVSRRQGQHCLLDVVIRMCTAGI